MTIEINIGIDPSSPTPARLSTSISCHQRSLMPSSAPTSCTQVSKLSSGLTLVNIFLCFLPTSFFWIDSCKCISMFYYIFRVFLANKMANNKVRLFNLNSWTMGKWEAINRYVYFILHLSIKIYHLWYHSYRVYTAHLTYCCTDCPYTVDPMFGGQIEVTSPTLVPADSLSFAYYDCRWQLKPPNSDSLMLYIRLDMLDAKNGELFSAKWTIIIIVWYKYQVFVR